MNLHTMLETLAAETAARIAREHGLRCAVQLKLPDDFLMVGFAEDTDAGTRERIVVCIGGNDIRAYTCLETLLRAKFIQARDAKG